MLFILKGHYYAGKSKGYTYLNDTYVLDVNSNRWHVNFSYFYQILLTKRAIER